MWTTVLNSHGGAVRAAVSTASSSSGVSSSPVGAAVFALPRGRRKSAIAVGSSNGACRVTGGERLAALAGLVGPTRRAGIGRAGIGRDVFGGETDERVAAP